MGKILRFKKRSKIKQFLKKHLFYEKFPIRAEKGIFYFEDGHYYNGNTQQNNLSWWKKRRYYVPFIGKYATVAQVLSIYKIVTFSL